MLFDFLIIGILFIICTIPKHKGWKVHRDLFPAHKHHKVHAAGHSQCSSEW